MKKSLSVVLSVLFALFLIVPSISFADDTLEGKLKLKETCESDDLPGVRVVTKTKQDATLEVDTSEFPDVSATLTVEGEDGGVYFLSGLALNKNEKAKKGTFGASARTKTGHISANGAYLNFGPNHPKGKEGLKKVKAFIQYWNHYAGCFATGVLKVKRVFPVVPPVEPPVVVLD